MSRYVCSDLHGCRQTFNLALKTIQFSKRDVLLIIGDICDRGPDTRGIVNDILRMNKEGFNIITLMGNHEDLLVKSLQGDLYMQETWTYNGALETLKSYGYTKTGYMNVRWEDLIPDEHKQFYMELPQIHTEWDDFVFVHAGLDFGRTNPIEDSHENDKLWERFITVDSSKIGGRTLVTGHTPTNRSKIIEMVECSDHIIIDNGCVFESETLNHLTVLNLDTFEITFVKNCEEG